MKMVGCQVLLNNIIKNGGIFCILIPPLVNYEIYFQKYLTFFKIFQNLIIQKSLHIQYVYYKMT